MERLLYRGDKKKVLTSALLTGLALGFCYLFCLRYGVFGAKVDWISQHSVLPDYFRQQFYDTGEFFPEFGANIGGGQNIYNFAYYGLYSPVILPSYLLPFVKMSDYMIAVQLLSLVASVLLMYYWLGNRGFSEKICVGTSLLFLLAGPVIFHSYHQIMFVNYMPFLLLGLWGVDRYFEDRRGGMLTISIFLMILTSFYFSIGGMLVLILYGIHRYLTVCEEEEIPVTFKGFLAEGIRFSVPFVLAVMMSGLLLVPTALTLTGRGGEGARPRLGELLIPRGLMARFCYSPYGIGLTSLGVTALTALLFGRKLQERVLAFSCLAVLTVPVFAYLLNGGLYVRDKVMIPFLPLLCYILSYHLTELSGGKSGRKTGRENLAAVLPYGLTMGLICMGLYQGNIKKEGILLLDGAVMLICCLAVVYWKKTSAILLIPAVFLLAVSDFTYHTQENQAVARDFYEEMTDTDIGEMIGEIRQQEEGFYRTEQLGDDTENAANLNRVWDMGQYVTSIYSSSYHEGYLKFREDTFRLEEPFRNYLMQSAVYNPVFQRFMGVKYVVAENALPGFEEVKSQGKWKVYRNDQAAPVIYATDRVMGEDDYRKLEFPYNQLALLEAAVVKEGETQDTKGAQETQGLLEAEGLEELVDPIESGLPESVDSEKDEEICVRLPVSEEKEAGGERVLFLRLQIENLRPSKDVAVWVEGIRNKLTAESHFYYNGNLEFTYAVPLEEGQETVEVVLGNGKYEIRGGKAFLGRLPEPETGEGSLSQEEGTEDGLYQSVFQPDWEKTKGNRIAGTIDVKNTGYVITTIPYDENFEILVDGKPVEQEAVNTAFLGFGIEAGKHEIRMVYHAPGVKAGKILSAAGLLLFLLYVKLIKKWMEIVKFF